MTQRLMAFLAMICCQSMVWSQEAAGPAQPGAKRPAGTIEEIEVRGTRGQLRELRQEIFELEEKFYAEYNRRNTEDRYDIKCAIEATTGSIIRARVCRPEFVNYATAEEAQALMAGEPAVPANQAIEEEFPDFKKNVLAVVSSNRDLGQLVLERNKVEKRYNALRGRKSGQEAQQPTRVKQPEEAKEPTQVKQPEQAK